MKLFNSLLIFSFLATLIESADLNGSDGFKDLSLLFEKLKKESDLEVLEATIELEKLTKETEELQNTLNQLKAEKRAKEEEAAKNVEGKVHVGEDNV